ncbi:DUF4238 domain-containing protein [Kaistia terrae]|uniref:DUF4238 domain-containing protein n=1 Tax=Kaistia terrae TaxID=537017 RepID=A0ABW0Q4W8_9HYPH|nr:DUF4238 domain-containing protein [Kaistia terrae]MCX5580280.1 DUF4238 domain-containing protein [Kaistia terrae]
MTNQPNKHHFLPVFYLKRWAGSDQRVCQFSKPHRDNVVPKRQHPDATGYIKRLYAIEGLPEEEAVAFERTFLSPVDSRAAEALEIMRDQHAASTFTAKQREAWAGFLASLMSRMPEDIRKVKEHVKGDWLAGVPELQEKYTEAKAAGDPESVLEYIRSSDDLLFEKGAFTVLRRIMDHKTAARAMVSFHWSVLKVEHARLSLLTSDRPLIYTHHMMGWDSCILLPIGPYEIFLAVKERGYADHIKNRSQTELVRNINQAVVENADHYIYGVDDQQLRFIQNRMGTNKAPTLVDRLNEVRRRRSEALSST